MNSFQQIKDWLFYYLVLVGVFYLLGIGYFPSSGIVVFQLILVFSALIFAYFFLRDNIYHRTLMWGGLIYQLVLTISYRVFNMVQYGEFLGYKPADAKLYHTFASKFSGEVVSFQLIWNYLETHHVSLDDRGFFSIVSIVYNYFYSDVGIHILSIINAAIIIIGAHLLYLLSLNFINERMSNFLSFLWIIMPFGLYTSSVGLKENFMVFFIIVSFYYLYCYINTHLWKYILLFLLFALILLLFRTALFFMLIFVLIFTIMMRTELFIHHINAWLVFMFIVAVLTFSFVTNYIGEIRGNVSMETIQSGREAKNAAGGSLIAVATNLLSTLIGPFPSFVSDKIKVNYITLFSLGSMIKMMLSLGYLYGIYYILKNRITQLYPILGFIALHSVMLFITFYSLHDRYQWPQYPFVLLISIFGMNVIYEENKKNFFCCRYYSFVIFLLIICYNLRITMNL